MEVVFKRIKKDNIFQLGFDNLESNLGTISFTKRHEHKGGLAIIYAPNGTGKTSFSKVLGIKESTEDICYTASDDNFKTIITPESNSFYIIPDQNSRNLIKGETEDYLVGKEIKREYKLRKDITNAFNEAFQKLNTDYKNIYNVSKVSHPFLKELCAGDRKIIGEFISGIVNTKKKGGDIDKKTFINVLRDNSVKRDYIAIDEEKKQFVISNYEMVFNINTLNVNRINAYDDIQEIEKSDDAIGILNKYRDLHACIVCDNDDIDVEKLLAKKNSTKEQVYNSLDEFTKKILEDIIKKDALTRSDPFFIKKKLTDVLKTGSLEELEDLKQELSVVIGQIENELVDQLLSIFDDTDTLRIWDEYQQLLESQPVIDDIDLLLITEIISTNIIGKEITLERDSKNGNNYVLKMNEQVLPGLSREKIQLSSGEQNFVSLAFELLLARNSNSKYIILDDPISSFDSIYKNKVAYCIVKFLEDKKTIVLTHNTDLIRLIEVQLDNCFNLYLMNNTENGENGFNYISVVEKRLLINLATLVKFFQNNNISNDEKNVYLGQFIKNSRLFLMSLIPFLRGYIHIIRDKQDYYGQLSRLMHGYESYELDVAKIYCEAFGYSVSPKEIISVNDILRLDSFNEEIIDKNEFPILNRTLQHSLLYYHLRMKVEYELTRLYKIEHSEKQVLLLTQIIQKAFKIESSDSDEQKQKKIEDRVFFASRKTLLNEFSHFEGNMNIFQPALDISDVALEKEKNDIYAKLKELKDNNSSAS